MDIKDLFPENEKPLDRLLPDGGFCGIFRSIGCIGDSLSSGEFEFYDGENRRRYVDAYEYSWGQYIARTIGCKVYNFSEGGMTVKRYLQSFAEEHDCWNPNKACQAYIIALGVNDMGSAQFSKEEFRQDYITLINKYKEIQPDAKFFLVTYLKGEAYSGDKKADLHAGILYEVADTLTNCYVMDFRKYGPVQDKEYMDKFYLTNHLSPCGYILTAKMMMSYMDYIIRHNMEDFKLVGMIGRDMSEVKYG